MTTIYPGMLDARTEYFKHDNSVYKLKNGKVKNFDAVENHPELQLLLYSEIGLKETLSEICNGNETQMLKTLAKCRFGGLNFEPDFDEHGNHNPDYTECSLRSTCIGNGIVCKAPEINGNPINEIELMILRSCVTNRKNMAIASDLNLPEGTFNVLKNNTYKRVGVLTKQQLALKLVEQGLL